MDKGSKISEPQTTEASELTCKLRKDMAKSKITAAESFISRATEAVINIFSEVSPQVECKEHMDDIMQHIIQNRNEAALDIAEFIWANKQAFGLNQPDGSSTSDHQSGYDPYFEDTDILRFLRDTDLSEIYIWNVLLNKIKTFFLRKIIKEVIVSYIVKLRNGPYGFSAEKTPLNAIVPVASEIVEALIPPSNQKKCVYKETQSHIFNSDYKMVSELLEEFLLDMIGTDDDPVKFRGINSAVKLVMSDVWEWLVYEVEERNQRNKAVRSLEKIKLLVIDFSKPTEEEPEEPTPPSTVVLVSSDDEEDELIDDDEDELIDDDEDELIDEDDDSLTPEVPLPNVTAQQPQSTEHIDPFYMLVVSAVLGQIFKRARGDSCHVHITVSQQDIKDMSSALALMLCTKMAGSDFVKPSSDNIEKTARAVHKALYKEMGSRYTVYLRMLSRDLIYEDVTETIKRHLVKPRQTGVKGFFNSFFKIVSYPFRACFTHG
ncbi:uncharacterized protein LOC113744336 [Larimichthys crocea]|uniref:uncharacterized protein LOC113744336 n=1 Tax=Larimichthys crocea TaxID=215358 RepID=UPI000F5F9FEB|nr:uncharacterized protein LOC113744336 [Larimichthys crocea]XP_027129323.1 uncharacterized protein LOC113744336 [Larimichthys crocea]XP_027129324.1 uncharacterized protein LOC113744336 [Larimichthys crocea]